MPLPKLSTDNTLTVSEVIAFLKKVEEEYGNLEINHVEFGGLSNTYFAQVYKKSETGDLIVVFSNEP